MYGFFFSGKPERPTYVWQDNIKTNLKEIKSNVLDRTSLQLHQLYALFYLLHTYIMFLLDVSVISPHRQGELACSLLKNRLLRRYCLWYSGFDSIHLTG